jgi:hypothetical protein
MATFGIKMVIVTREEIEKLASGEELAWLIKQKVCSSTLPAAVATEDDGARLPSRPSQGALSLPRGFRSPSTPVTLDPRTHIRN